jgi:hypothetical protein
MLNIPNFPKEAIAEIEKLKSAYWATIKFARAGLPSISPEALESRQSICRSCDQWDAKAINGTGRCKKCGCSTWAKLRMATEKCPLGKWEAVSVEEGKQ